MKLTWLVVVILIALASIACAPPGAGRPMVRESTADARLKRALRGPRLNTSPSAQRSVHELIAEDMAPRAASRWELTREEVSPKKLLSDCEFKKADLNGDGAPEVIVKAELYITTREGQRFGQRSAHGCGDFYIYAVAGGKPKLIGLIEGDSWSLLQSRSHGYADLRTYKHWMATEGTVGIYSYLKGEYRLKSNGQYDFSGQKPRLIEWLKEPAE